MTGFRVEAGAGHRIDEIYLYTLDTWGAAQADRYIRGLFERFEEIAARREIWRQIPAEFGVNGYFCRYEKHVIYWRLLSDGDVGIATILHERMHRIERLQAELGN